MNSAHKNPLVSGPWRIEATSSSTGEILVIDSNLSQSNNVAFARNENLALFTHVPRETRRTVRGREGGDGQNSLSLAFGGSRCEFAFDEGGDIHAGVGEFSGDAMSGSYSSLADNGTWTATRASLPALPFRGMLNHNGTQYFAELFLVRLSSDLAACLTLHRPSYGVATLFGKQIGSSVTTQGAIEVGGAREMVSWSMHFADTSLFVFSPSGECSGVLEGYAV